MKTMLHTTRLLVAGLCLAISAASLQAQVFIDPAGDGGFENGTTFADNGWTVVNGSVTNQWYLGTAPTGFGGSRVAYISNNGGTNHAYSNGAGATSVVHFYRDVTFPAGVPEFVLSFNWQAEGEFSSFDAIMVSLAPTTYTPTASNVSLGTGRLPAPANMLGQQLWRQGNVQTATFTIKSSALGNCSAPATWRLIFTWKNDDSLGENPPGAIDNISLTSVPMTISQPADRCVNGNNIAYSATPVPVSGETGVFSISPATPGFQDNGNGTANWTIAGATPGAYVVTYTFTNSTDCQFIVRDTVNLLPQPTATISNTNGLTLDCNNPQTTLGVPAASSYNWTRNGDPLSTDQNISVTQAGTYAVTVIAANGCTASSSAVVNFAPDNTPPSITCPITQPLTLGANCSATLPSYTSMATTGDNCGVQSVTQSPQAGTTVSGTGNMAVTLTVTDVNDLTNTCSFTVTKVDNTPPTIACPTTQTLTLGANCSATLPSYTSMATTGDNCGVQSVTQSPEAGTTVSGTGNMTVTLTVTDVNDLTNTCTFTVTNVDNTPPSITCPPPVTVTCASQIPAVNPDAVSASDNCGTPTKTFLGAITSDSTCVNRKTVTRTYRATDGSGNSNTCSQSITVNDNVLPTFTSVPANVTVQCNSVPAPGIPTATDGCGGSVTITYNGQIRSGQNCTDSYILTRQWTAIDLCGNTRTATQRINVIDSQKPAFVNTPANLTVQCDAIPAPATPTATDNCATAVAVTYNGQTTTNGNCPNAYTLTRRWTAADNCGNTVSISQRITVVDTGKPVFTSFPENTTIACNDPIPPGSTPTATDGCGSATVTYLGQTTANNSCPGTYQIRRTWRATDACGNSTVATQTIQVSDTGAPVFTFVPADVTISCNQPLPPLQNPTASDACGGFVSITFLGNVPTGNGCAQDYTVTRTWRAQDLCGNTATATQVITVQGSNYGAEGAEDRADAERPPSTVHRLAIIPNPTTDRIWLDLTNFAGEAVTISIFGELGQLVWERHIPAVEELKLSVSLREAGAATGVYTVSVRSTSSLVAKRVLLAE